MLLHTHFRHVFRAGRGASTLKLSFTTFALVQSFWVRTKCVSMNNHEILSGLALDPSDPPKEPRGWWVSHGIMGSLNTQSSALC
ncbi:uncharacterized protein H6S33_012143 [Morchella sextelata]|uniref:uncharacterized protein n=1 Tax=Morchella sextelata TaxID=1174677 RepID=UPI001D037453|nr:uncharacterized protein H6S33_012143 [Morchella sextelata]KAH0610616.1 hypothetical protein H6S33_012143 [Morchella sextelata]